MTDASVITPPTKLDSVTAADLSAAILRSLENGHRTLIVDFDGVRLVDIAAVGALLSAQRMVEAAGAEIAVTNLSAHMRRVFVLTGVSRSLRCR